MIFVCNYTIEFCIHWYTLKKRQVRKTEMDLSYGKFLETLACTSNMLREYVTSVGLLEKENEKQNVPSGPTLNGSNDVEQYVLLKMFFFFNLSFLIKIYFRNKAIIAEFLKVPKDKIMYKRRKHSEKPDKVYVELFFANLPRSKVHLYCSNYNYVDGLKEKTNVEQFVEGTLESEIVIGEQITI